MAERGIVMSFSYSKARFSVRPPRPAIGDEMPAVPAFCKAQRKGGDQRDELVPHPAMNPLAMRLVEFAYDDAPPRDAAVELHCCGEHGDLPGMPYARVWSDTRRPARAGWFCCWEGFDATQHVLAGPLSLDECVELHDLLEPAARRVGCGERDEQPEPRKGNPRRPLEELRQARRPDR